MAIGAVVVKEIAHETELQTEGYFTVDGVRCIPLYEPSHATGPIKELPDKTNCLYMEGNFTDNSFNPSISPEIQRLNQYSESTDFVLNELFVQSPGRKKVIEKATQKQMPIGIGDIVISLDNIINKKWVNESEKPTTQEDINKFWTGVGISLISYYPAVMDMLPDNIRETLHPPAITRRQFLQVSTAVVGTALGA